MRAPWIKNPLINIDLLVSDLIDFRKRDWLIDKLDDLFYPDDVVKIRVNKPVVGMEDFWIWKHNKSGDYSVKSGYWLAYQIYRGTIISQATLQPSTNDLKAQVWKLQTEPKIKVFLWKVLSGAVPVLDLLSCRGMKLDTSCQSCGCEGESIQHVLFGCSFPRQVWAMSDYPNPERGMDVGSVFTNINHFLINRDNLRWPIELRRSFPWTIWRIWKNRNLFFYEGKRFSPLETMEKVRKDVEDWFAAQEVEEEREDRGVHDGNYVSHLTPFSFDQGWKPPPHGWFKCNVGLSWSQRNGLAGGAWVLRDETGLVLLHSRRAFFGIESLQDAHLLSIIWAVESMGSHKMSKVIFGVGDAFLVGVTNRPQAWPSFRFHSSEILAALGAIMEWRMVFDGLIANRGAFLIAKSVTRDCRLQSYVAAGFPFWLAGVFRDERAISSV